MLGFSSNYIKIPAKKTQNNFWGHIKRPFNKGGCRKNKPLLEMASGLTFMLNLIRERDNSFKNLEKCDGGLKCDTCHIPQNLR